MNTFVAQAAHRRSGRTNARGRGPGIRAGLGTATGAAVVGSFLLLTWGSTVSASAAIALDFGRWIAAVLLLGLIVAVLVRIAPAEHPEPRWASTGSVLIVVCWLVATLLYKLWLTEMIDLQTTTGILAGLLALALYLFVTAALFLVGVQLDETLRKLTFVTAAVFLVGVQLDETLRKLTHGNARGLLPLFSR
jgi:membrane protein